MTPQEKLIQAIQDGLVEKYGDDFFKLSEMEQVELIIQVMQEHLIKK